MTDTRALELAHFMIYTIRGTKQELATLLCNRIEKVNPLIFEQMLYLTGATSSILATVLSENPHKSLNEIRTKCIEIRKVGHQ